MNPPRTFQPPFFPRLSVASKRSGNCTPRRRRSSWRSGEPQETPSGTSHASCSSDPGGRRHQSPSRCREGENRPPYSTLVSAREILSRLQEAGPGPVAEVAWLKEDQSPAATSLVAWVDAHDYSIWEDNRRFHTEFVVERAGAKVIRISPEDIFAAERDAS